MEPIDQWLGQLITWERITEKAHPGETKTETIKSELENTSKENKEESRGPSWKAEAQVGQTEPDTHSKNFRSQSPSLLFLDNISRSTKVEAALQGGHQARLGSGVEYASAGSARDLVLHPWAQHRSGLRLLLGACSPGPVTGSAQGGAPSSVRGETVISEHIMASLHVKCTRVMPLSHNGPTDPFVFLI